MTLILSFRNVQKMMAPPLSLRLFSTIKIKPWLQTPQTQKKNLDNQVLKKE